MGGIGGETGKSGRSLTTYFPFGSFMFSFCRCRIVGDTHTVLSEVKLKIRMILGPCGEMGMMIMMVNKIIHMNNCTCAYLNLSGDFLCVIGREKTRCWFISRPICHNVMRMTACAHKF